MYDTFQIIPAYDFLRIYQVNVPTKIDYGVMALEKDPEWDCGKNSSSAKRLRYHATEQYTKVLPVVLSRVCSCLKQSLSVSSAELLNDEPLCLLGECC
ncbi:hypothetical protein NPIL_30671 [Nephila pilipes]|uniref:Uncharacterized protein n=1 Tax=Nephila pilipes TaxID=299642 RepID=A0A8X6R7S9_NEPPI|nr:hypothetical protein NPIL_30671 [Nephila pilipes]